MNLAVLHGLGPMLYWILRKDPCVPLSALRLLEGAHKVAEFNYQSYKDKQELIQSQFTSNDIPLIWLKGIALAQIIYPKPGLRPMDDLDLLVLGEDRALALETALSCGYQIAVKDELSRKISLPQQGEYHYSLRYQSPERSILEIHFNLTSGDGFVKHDDLGWFWQNKEEFEQGNSKFFAFNPTAQLLHLCSHAILQHGEANFRLQRYYDINVLLEHKGIDWEILLSKALDLGWSYAVNRALSITTEYFCLELPDGVLKQLTAQVQKDENYHRALALKSKGSRWSGTFRKLKAYPLKVRIRAIFYLTFPPPRFMRERYAVSSDRCILPFYFVRWVDVSKEFINAMMNNLARIFVRWKLK